MAARDQRLLGEIFVRRGDLTEQQLALLLAEQERTGRMLGELIVTNGFATSAAVSAALAEQKGWTHASFRTSDEPGAESESRPDPPERHFLFVAAGAGYELVEQPGPAPAQGETVELSLQDAGALRYLVVKRSRAPFPGSRIDCAYLHAV